jgi:hypothetical protein
MSKIINPIYSIPVKVVESNNAKKCTIPKQIADKMKITKGDFLIWSYYENGKVEVRVEKIE